MNRVILMGRLTREPDIRYSQRENTMAIARYTLAVDRRVAAGQEQQADFIPCVSFGKAAEFVEKYLHKGTKIVISGRIQTGSYTNRDGQRVYTTEVIIEEQEFAESKASAASRDAYQQTSRPASSSFSAGAETEGFMNIPDDVEDQELPFS